MLAATLLALIAVAAWFSRPMLGRVSALWGDGADRTSSAPHGLAPLAPMVGPRIASVCQPGEQGSSNAEQEAPAASFQTPAVSSQMTIVELLADTRTNEARRAAGLPELEVDEQIRDIARTHSQDMFRRGFFAHADPDGAEATQRVHRGHRRLIGEVGENIWMCRGCWQGNVDPLVEAMVLGKNGWMQSPGHRENILSKTFTHGVVGVWQNGPDVWATQVFSATRGYLAQGVPREISQKSCFTLAVGTDSDPSPSAFELFSVGTDGRSLGVGPLGSIRLEAAPGRYLLKFRFPTGPNRYSVVTGPTVRVR